MKKMLILGISLVYVIICLVMTILSICVSEKGIFNSEKIYELRWLIISHGTLSIILGIALCLKAVVYQKMVKIIKLLTTGVYSIVRNPTYSIFYIVFIRCLLYRGKSVVVNISNIILAVLAVYDSFFKTIGGKGG